MAEFKKQKAIQVKKIKHNIFNNLQLKVSKVK